MIFVAIAKGVPEVLKTEVVRYQDERIFIFDAKFPQARFQYTTCPIEHIESVKDLNSSHIELLETMFSKTIEIIGATLQASGHQIPEDFSPSPDTNGISFGYNFPPSVPHLQ